MKLVARLRRWWRTRRDPLGALIWEPDLDGPGVPLASRTPRSRVTPTTRKRRYSPRKKRRPYHRLPPLVPPETCARCHRETEHRKAASEVYCTKCGWGRSPDDSYYDRSALAGEAAPREGRAD